MASPEKRKEFLQMLSRYRQGIATENEKKFIENYLKNIEKDKNISDSLSTQDISALETKIWAGIQEHTTSKPAPVHNIFPWRKIAIAASIIFAIGIATYFVMPTKEASQTLPIASTGDVPAPTSSRATITLTDGRTISIDSLNSLTQDNITVTKTADGQIVYSGAIRSLQTTDQPIYNTLTNPRGSKVIDIQLADGSHVWLNAGSSLTYPIAFAGNERKVSITGEAYFEVAHDASKPFYVSKGDMNVQVLGTHFNVNAYDNEQDIKVTLLEGSVKVLPTASAVGTVIKPGQQAAVTLSTTERLRPQAIEVLTADLDQTMAWKNGFTSFKSADLQTIMRQVERWYDVDVNYEAAVPQRTFTGEIPREVNLSELLKLFEANNIHFTIDATNKKLTVKP